MKVRNSWLSIRVAAVRGAASIVAMVVFAGLNASAVDFSHDVVPVLRQHCADCHTGNEAEGGFNFNSRSLALESGVIEAGDADASVLVERLITDDPDMRMPPPDRPGLSASEVRVLIDWIDQGVAWQAGFQFGEAKPELPLRLKSVSLPGPSGDHPLDQLVGRYFQQHEVRWPDAADDSTLLRRTMLDWGGRLPSAQETTDYLADTSPQKHTRLIQRLADDRVGYADHWLTFWNDLLRNDYEGTGFITKGRTQISGWLYQALLENRPYDQMVRQLINPPDDSSAGFINGIKWRGEVSAGQSLPIQFSQSVSQALLGINMKCASCHDSFIDRWTLGDAYSLAAVYADKPLAMYRCDKPTGAVASAAWIYPEMGEIDPQADRGARLRRLAGLMTAESNGRFSRTIVNRLWAQLMGRGLIHPTDAMQTPPWDHDLLDYLAGDFVRRGYNLQGTLRLITTSRIYRCQTVIDAGSADGEGDAFVFRGPVAKRLTAEQFVDAIGTITGQTPKKADAPVQRDADRVRASLVKADSLQRSLGRPNRDQIVTSRPSDVTTLEALTLANDPTLAQRLRQGASRLLDQYRGPSADIDGERLIDDVYLTCFARHATSRERQVVLDSLGDQPTDDGLADFLWAVIVQPEFWYVR
ncbi:PSD1 and planctomycete cytochrome C domain-containing protein [Crateriforma conspicua]|uniref:Planctomycete cytochrome C n=1 Tax=Crateriforma conspicua TaxID=2527996 RepID=A0A5C5XZG2_9PLAN|nr:PSD1 and planctomycete cytochrome C domain-containing protein [Crateriforma conspicua]TWT68284.1 Planctomycete cytochrome C [Crateriforma conspicua]